MRDLQADLAKLNLGKNILYDGAKYFHRASKRWADVRVDNVNPCTFDNSIKKSISCEKQSELLRFQDHNITLSDYMRYYLCAENSDIDRDKFVPPINMVLQKYNLGTCDESIMTFWTMRIIIDVCKTIKEPPSTDIFDEYLIQTQEDMYYYTLAVLHDTYAVREQKNE